MDYIAKIKLFIEGKLKAEDHAAFELEIKNNAALREEVDDYRKIFSGFEGLREEAFKDQVQSWSKELPDVKESKILSFWSNSNVRRIAVAAVVVLVSTIIYLVVPSGEVIKPSITIEEDKNLVAYAGIHYVKPTLDLFRGENDGAKWLKEAKEDFIKGKLQECIDKIERIDQSDSSYLESQFIKAHSLYQLKEYQRAEKIFIAIEENKKEDNYSNLNFDLDNAAWTLILCRLQSYIQGGIKKDILLQSIELFLQRKIIGGDYDDYKEKAERLKELLE